MLQDQEPASGGRFSPWAWSILLALAGVLRLVNLDQPMRTDEATTFLALQGRSALEILSAYTPNNHLLHSLLVKLSVLCLGPAEWALRLPAFLAGWGLVASLGFIAGRIKGPATAFITASLASCSAWLTAYSTDSRGYSLACLLLVWAFFLFWRWTTGGRKRDQFWAGALAGLAVAAVLSQLWALAGLGLALVLYRAGPGLRAGERLAGLARFLAGAALGGGVWYLPALIEHGLSPIIANEHVVRVGLLPAARSAAFQVVELAGYAWPIPGFDLLSLALIGAAGLFLLLRHPGPEIKFAALLGGWSFFIEVVQGVRAPAWTFIYLIPLIHLLWAMVLVRPRPGPEPAARLKPALAVPCLVLAGAVSLFLILEAAIPNSGPGRFPEARKVADYLVDQARIDPADRIIALSPDQQPLLYYLWRRGETKHLDLPRGTLEGKRVFIVGSSSNPYPRLAQAWPALKGKSPRLLFTQDRARLWVLERESPQARKRLDRQVSPG